MNAKIIVAALLLAGVIGGGCWLYSNRNIESSGAAAGQTPSGATAANATPTSPTPSNSSVPSNPAGAAATVTNPSTTTPQEEPQRRDAPMSAEDEKMKTIVAAANKECADQNGRLALMQRKMLMELATDTPQMQGALLQTFRDVTRQADDQTRAFVKELAAKAISSDVRGWADSFLKHPPQAQVYEEERAKCDELRKEVERLQAEKVAKEKGK